MTKLGYVSFIFTDKLLDNSGTVQIGLTLSDGSDFDYERESHDLLELMNMPKLLRFFLDDAFYQARKAGHS